MKKLLYLLLISGLILGLVACANNEDKNKEEKANNEKATETTENKNGEEQNNEGTAIGLPDLDDQKTVEMMLEGMPEEKVVKVYHHKELGFSTYVPDDMVVESNPEVFNVFTNFGGTKNEDATLKITGQNEEDVTKDLSDLGFTLNNQDEKVLDFSDKEFLLEKEGMIGRVALFTHSDQDYALYYYYPEEFADGFGPRSDIIIKEIVWHDEQEEQ